MSYERTFLIVLFTSLVWLLIPSVALAQNGSHGSVASGEGYGEEEERSEEVTQAGMGGELEGESNAQEQVVREERVERVERTNTSWAGVLARNALAGGLTGGLIGIGFWLLTDMSFSWFTVAQFAGGGVLVGTVIGAVELASQPDRTYVLTQPDSIRWVGQEAPRPLMVPVLKMRF